MISAKIEGSRPDRKKKLESHNLEDREGIRWNRNMSLATVPTDILKRGWRIWEKELENGADEARRKEERTCSRCSDVKKGGRNNAIFDLGTRTTTNRGKETVQYVPSERNLVFVVVMLVAGAGWWCRRCCCGGLLEFGFGVDVLCGQVRNPNLWCVGAGPLCGMATATEGVPWGFGVGSEGFRLRVAGGGIGGWRLTVYGGLGRTSASARG